jgi:HPt (histidine-containing phosphotransfer) domain-containing protein
MKQYIDTDEALGRLMKNKKLLCRLLTSFLANEGFSMLKDEIIKKDYKAASDHAHAIKGVAANLSLKALYERMKILEQMLKDGADVDYIAEYNEIAVIMDETVKCVKEVIAKNQA